MRYLFFILLTTLSYGKVLDNQEVDSNKPALQVVSVQDSKHLESIKKQLINENLFIKKLKNYFVVIIVNFDNEEEMLKKKEALKFRFKDSIIMSKLSNRILVPKTMTANKRTVLTPQTPIKSVFNQSKKQNEKSTKKNIIKSKYSKEDILKYQKAVNFFKIKNYENSYELFNELFINYLDDDKINFYLGRSAFEIKKYNEAYAAFQRVQIKDENNQRVRLEIARILYVLKSYDNALKEFEIVLKNPIPSQVRKNVQALIDSIKNKQKKYFFSGAYQLGFGWDNNVNNNTYLDFTTFGSTFLTNDTAKITDSFNKEVLVLNYIRPFEEDKSLAFESSSIFYLQNYFDEYYKNIALISLTNGISKIKNKRKVVLNLLTDKIWYGSESLLVNYGISPKITYLYDKSTIFDASLKYVKKKMSQSSDNDKDANIKNITLSLTKKFEDKSNVQVKTYFTAENKVRGIRTDVAKNLRGITLSYAKEFVPSYNTLISYQYDQSIYKENDPSLPSRRDNSDIYSLNITKTIDDTSSLSVNYSFIDVTSNIETNTYDKNTIGITYTKLF